MYSYASKWDPQTLRSSRLIQLYNVKTIGTQEYNHPHKLITQSVFSIREYLEPNLKDPSNLTLNYIHVVR